MYIPKVEGFRPRYTFGIPDRNDVWDFVLGFASSVPHHLPSAEVREFCDEVSDVVLAKQFDGYWETFVRSRFLARAELSFGSI